MIASEYEADAPGHLSLSSDIKIVDAIIEQHPELCCLSEEDVDMAFGDGALPRLLSMLFPRRLRLICPELDRLRTAYC